MKAPDETKKAAAAVHGNGEMTRDYTDIVRNATETKQITEASRELAKDVLLESGNEVNDDNATRLLWAAQDVVNGTQAYYAIKDHGLKADGISSETRRAMQMLGNYMNEVIAANNSNELERLLGYDVDGQELKENQEQEQREQYDIKEPEKEKVPVMGKTWSEQIDLYKANRLKRNTSLVMGGTPEILRRVGFSSLPMTMNQSHVDFALYGKPMDDGTIDYDHKIGIDTLKELPELIKKPVAVIASETDEGYAVVVVSR